MRGTLTLWYLCTALLAVCAYFYGLDSQYIPKNGDEYPYEHIARMTAAKGGLLPLRSEMENMRNTKPPLLFWQGMASTRNGQDWSLQALRYPSVIYTLLTAALLFLLGRRLRDLETGFIAALTFLAFFSTYRFGRPYLTNPPEVFWLFLPFFALLYWPQAFRSRTVFPLLAGISLGLAFLYKSFALGLPAALGLGAWHLQQRHYRFGEFFRHDAGKVAVSIAVAVAMFALWFVLDPDPHAVWQEFVVGENVGKFDPHGPSYLAKLLWGGSSVWSYTAAFLTNAGLLTFIVVALCLTALRNRRDMRTEQQLLWLWVAALFFSFCLPSQRSGRYLLAAMPAVALLAALDWRHIGRSAFIATLSLCAAAVLGLGLLAGRLQSELGSALFPATFWLLLGGSAALALAAIAIPAYTRAASNTVALLVLLCFAAFLRPLDDKLANYDARAVAYAQGKTVAVPCNFRAHDEGHRFLLPGANIVGYHESQHLDVALLSQRYELFAVQLPLHARPGELCAACTAIGTRLDIRGRQSPEELRDMFFNGKFFEHLFVREVLVASAVTPKQIVSNTLAEVCR